MTGAVIVAAANLPPTVSITNPASGTVFAAPANVTIQASASDSDGTVTNVQFLVDANIWPTSPPLPFPPSPTTWRRAAHTLSAIASDNNGATATNSVSISVVTPVTVLLSAPQAGAAREIQVQLHGECRAELHRPTFHQSAFAQLDHPRHQHGGQWLNQFHGPERDGQSGLLPGRTSAESVIVIKTLEHGERIMT